MPTRSATLPMPGTVKWYFRADKDPVTVCEESLTVRGRRKDTFRVCVIPHAYGHSGFHAMRRGPTGDIGADTVGGCWAYAGLVGKTGRRRGPGRSRELAGDGQEGSGKGGAFPGFRCWAR